MFDYLQQFNRLPKDLRDKVSSPSAMAAISELEAKYKADLAATVMKVMVKSISLKELSLHLSSESGLSPSQSEELSRELRERVFSSVGDYLGLTTERRALDLDKDIEVIIKEAGLVLPSQVLVSRFKTILSTFLRGIRSKIDTRNTLTKDMKIGGLNLGPEEVERIFKICAAHKFSNLVTGSSGQLSELYTPAQLPVSSPVVSETKQIVQPVEKIEIPQVPPRLAEIIAQADQAGGYDLKKSLEKNKAKLEPGIGKTSTNLDPSHEISAPKPQLDLPLLDKTLKSAAALSQSITAAAPLVPPVVSPAPLATPNQTTSPAPLIGSNVKPEPLKKPSELVKSTGAKVNPEKAVEKAPLPVSPAANRPAPSASLRPQMHDIKPMPKVMGPIEELQFLDVVNFRRLGVTPAEAVNKIYAKIKLLEKEGYDKMVAGVKAWRQSPTNRLYLRLGQESVAKSRPFNDILIERKKSGQDYLSIEEVQAIMALNGKLVF